MQALLAVTAAMALAAEPTLTEGRSPVIVDVDPCNDGNGLRCIDEVAPFTREDYDRIANRMNVRVKSRGTRVVGGIVYANPGEPVVTPVAVHRGDRKKRSKCEKRRASAKAKLHRR